MGQDWYEPYRYQRIEEMLADQAKHDLDSMRRMQGDQFSIGTDRLLPYLKETARSARRAGTLPASLDASVLDAAIEALDQFDSVMRADSAAALIVAAWA